MCRHIIFGSYSCYYYRMTTVVTIVVTENRMATHAIFSPFMDARCWAPIFFLIVYFFAHRVHVCKSTSFTSGARVLQRLPCFKYYNVLKWNSRFTLGLDATKITDYINNNRQDSLSSALKTYFSLGRRKNLGTKN